jgi:Capsular polysaccharide synthesis protein
MEPEHLLIVMAVLALALTVIRPNRQIPKIIWTHWNTADLPASVATIWQERQRTLPTWRHIMVHDDTVEKFVGPTPPAVRRLSHQHRADWIRLQLLRKYGGVWADSGIIFNSEPALNALHASAANSDLGVFDMFKSDGQYLENWFIIAPPQSPLICAWADEFDHAIKVGFHVYKRSLFRSGIQIHEKIYKNDDGNEWHHVYLTQHAALQAAIQRYPGRPRLVTWPAEDSMFSVQIACDWNHECIIKRLEDPSIKHKYPYIKLRGGDRRFDVKRYFA